MSLEGKASATIQNYVRAPKELMLYYDKLPEECTVEQIKSFLIAQRDKLRYFGGVIEPYTEFDVGAIFAMCCPWKWLIDKVSALASSEYKGFLKRNLCCPG